MKVKWCRKYILIESDRLIVLISKFSATKIRAGAFFPFIVIDSELSEPSMTWAINHELIHFAQQKELLFIGVWIVRLIEIIYFRVFKKKPKRETYILHCAEQEAYSYMKDSDYLITRRHFTHLREFLRNKKVSLDDLPVLS